MENRQLWYLIQSIHNSVDFVNISYPDNVHIETRDNWYRLDVFDDRGNPLSLTIYKEYSINTNTTTYLKKILLNGSPVKCKTDQVYNDILNEEFIPILRDFQLSLII